VDWDFDTLALAAVYYNPGLAVARAQAESTDAGRLTAAGRPNPTAGFQGGYNFNAAGTGLTPWIPGTTIDLPIETAGKRTRRIERAGHLARAARLNLAGAAWAVRSTLRTAVIDWAGAERRQALLGEELTIQEGLNHLLEQRLRAGAVSTTELGASRVAALRLRGEIADTTRLALEARQRVAEALGVSTPALAGLRILPPGGTATLTEEQVRSLRSRALQTRSDIQAALAAYEAAQSQLQLEIARQYPDLHLGNGYQWDQGDSKWSFGINLELPVLNRNQGPIAEAEAHRREAAAQVLATQARALGEIDRAIALDQALKIQRQRLTETEHELTQQLERLSQRFQGGGADRLEVETARIEAAVQRLALLDVELRLSQVHGQLEDALQMPLGDTRSIAFPPPQPVPSPRP
jgi:hypothetical protein